MQVQDNLMSALLKGDAKKDEIRGAVALMRCQIQLANLGLRQAKLADRIVPQSDYIPEVYFIKGASDAAIHKRGVRVDKEYLEQKKEDTENASV
jgi:hypothetical protein